LNEERFAKSYARGKFRISKWGRNKILYGLRGKKVADYCIQKGLLEIDEEEYITVLDDLITKKLKGETSFEARQKVVASLQNKGFEQEIILQRMKTIKVKM
jgi:regulatory protein